MAKKVLAQLDLNLVLTEYYKEKLESQLKNRKIYTNGFIWIESTDLTKLQILTDWTPYTKLLSTRSSLLPPSPRFFLLFLSPNITLLPSTSTIISLSFFQSHSYLPLLYHPCAKPLLVSELTNKIKDNKMSKKDTTISNNTPLPLII